MGTFQLECTLCGTVYKIGEDATITTMEDLQQASFATVIITDGRASVRNDLVGKFSPDWDPEWLEEKRRRRPTKQTSFETLLPVVSVELGIAAHAITNTLLSNIPILSLKSASSFAASGDPIGSNQPRDDNICLSDLIHVITTSWNNQNCKRHDLYR